MASDIITSQRHIHSFSWNHHRQTFFNTIFNLRKEEVFCDVTLVCDGVLFPVHRLVLAMCSEFFNEILTKVPNQQPMLVLVPTVSAEDLEALLTYVYRGEIQVSQTNLPSIMKAAKILKIKGFCHTNVERIPWEQYMRDPGEEEETNNKESREESDSRDSIFSVLPDSPEEITQESSHLPQLKTIVPKYHQVEVFIDNTEESHDMIYDEEIEAEKEEIREVSDSWMKMEAEKGGEEEELDPLSVPLAPHTLAFTSPDQDSTTYIPDTPLPVEVSWSEDSYQEQLFNTSACAATTSGSTSCTSSTGCRYTAEQKLEIVKNYYHYGPTKTARIMSELLSRKINESSVRSIVRAWIRNQKANRETNKETE